MLLNVIGVIIVTAAVLSPEDVKLDMTLEKPTYYPGEPIKLKLELTNVDSSPLQDCRLAMNVFEFNIRSTVGNLEYMGDRKEIYDRHTSFWPRCYKHKHEPIPPQGRISGDIALLEWFYQSFQPGDYTIQCQIHFSYERNQKVEITCPLHIIPQDEQSHRQILKTLYEKYDIERIGTTTCVGPCELLASARSPFAVEYFLKMLRPVAWDINWLLVDSLEIVGTKEATLGLINLVENNENISDLRQDGYTLPTATRAIYAIRKKGDTEILKASENFIKTHPCPPKPFLMPD